jgi:hypothetical protein
VARLENFRGEGLAETALSHGVKNMRRRFIVADLRFIK